MKKKYAQISLSGLDTTKGIVTNIVDIENDDFPAFSHTFYIEIAPYANITVGMHYKDGQFTTPPAPEPPPPEPVTIPITDFYGLFGSQVSLLGQIQLSTIPAVVGLRTMLNSYQTLTKGHPVLNGGIDALVGAQLLTTQQAEKLKNFEPL